MNTPIIDLGAASSNDTELFDALTTFESAIERALHGLAEAIKTSPRVQEKLDCDHDAEDENEDEDPSLIALLDLQRAFQRALIALRQALL